METNDIQINVQRAFFFQDEVFNDSMQGDNNLRRPRFNEKAPEWNSIQGLLKTFLALIPKGDYFTSSKSTSVTSGSPAFA